MDGRDRSPAVRRTFSAAGPILPPTIGALPQTSSTRRLSMSVSNLLSATSAQSFSRHAATLTHQGSGSGGSKRRLRQSPSPASGGSLSRKQAERQQSVKSRYSNKSNKSARHDDEQLYAREDGEVEVEEIGSRVTEHVSGEAARQLKKEWIVPHDATAMASPPASPSPSKLRVSWSTPTSLLRPGNYLAAHRLGCWIGVVLMHLVCTILYGLLATVHAKLPQTDLGAQLRKYSPDLEGLASFAVATYVYSVILTGAHGVTMARMIYQSLRNRQLMYYAPNYFSAARIDQIMPFSASVKALTGVAPANPRAPRPTTQNVLRSLILRCWWIFQEMLWARRDLVQLNSSAPSERMYRATVIGQTIVHFFEVVTMSHLVGVGWLQYVYVVLVITNALLPLICTLLRNAQAILWHSHRISSLLLSIVLDVFGVLVVPATFIHSYSSDYDVSLENFVKKRWLCDRWLVRMLLEIQFLLAVNTLSSVLRLLMGLHLLCSLNALKSLLESVTSSRPPIPSTERSVSVSGSPAKTAFLHMRLIIVKPGARRAVTMEVLLVLIGVVLLTAHLNVESKTRDTNACPLPLRPLFLIDPVCPLLELNCATNAAVTSGGNGADIERLMNDIDHESVRHFVIRSCPRVQITHAIYRLPRLVEFKIRHSTLASWLADAALTQSSHPTIRRFGAVNVSMTELPAGLLSTDFPSTLQEIDFCSTNVSFLPTNLHEHWPHVEALALELSGVDSVPDTVLHMAALRGLSLRGNNISSVPTALLAKKGLIELSLSSNPIQVLPSDVEISTLKLLAMDSTNVRSLPTWAAAAPELRIRAGATPFCDNLDVTTSDKRVDCTTQPTDVVFPLLTAE